MTSSCPEGHGSGSRVPIRSAEVSPNRNRTGADQPIAAFRSILSALTFEHVAFAGDEIVQESIDQPYGVRDCTFRDPSGDLSRFTQALNR